MEEDAETEADADAHPVVGAARNCVDVNEVGLPLGRTGRGCRYVDMCHILHIKYFIITIYHIETCFYLRQVNPSVYPSGRNHSESARYFEVH